MTNDEIIQIAKQAGLIDVNYEVGQWDVHEVTTFAKLVATKQREVSATFIEELDERGFKELAALIRKKGITND